MLILSDNKDNKEFNRKSNNFKKRRVSVVVDHFNKNSFGDFYKIRQKQRKNSAIVHFERGNNNYDPMKKKNKFRKLNSKQIQEDSSTSNNQENQLIKNRKSKPKKTNKNKISMPITELEKKKNEEEEKEKTNEKKTNIIKIESLCQNIQKDENCKVQIEKKTEIYKTKKKYCFFCCLKSNLDDSDIK